MLLKFAAASITYGVSAHPIIRSEELAPFLDFNTDDNWEDQVFHAMAIISAVTGGHEMRDASIHYHPQFVTVFGNGFSIRWGEPAFVYNYHVSMEDNLRAHEAVAKQVVVCRIPFNVRAPNIRNGWERAEKTARI